MEDWAFDSQADNLDLLDYADTTAPESSTPPEAQPIAYSSKTLPAPETRRFEDCLSEFVIAQADDKTIRRRKRFSNDRRKEVEHIRKAGACIRCRLTKTACKLELPCASCMKACRNVALSRTLCTRQRLIDIRFTADLWDIQEEVLWLKEEVPALFGPRKRLNISLTTFCDANSLVFNTDAGSQIWASGGHDGPWSVAKPLEIVVQDFIPTAGKEHRHIFERSPYAGSGGTTTAPQCYAIPDDSLPNLETLEAWALETSRHHPRAFVRRFRAPFLSLARRYCECKKPLPLQDLMRTVVRMTCLHGIWCSDLPRPRDSRQPFHQYASNAVCRQIRVIVARGIVDTEVEILSLLQKYVFGKKGPGRGNMLPIWTCLWLLILMYRETLFYYDNSGREGDFYQLAQHMYNMLVSLYSALFRPSSPLWLNWLRDDIYELFGRDWRIMEAMGTLKTEIGQYASGETTADMD
ncbi:hypothetical protein N431DRAFT_478944 [Stipitochalara longipes BDJ]|nr:hypothetical protein N431DRAFT_478944 [Stipitochalara longipes BDJ]